ncbi:peptidase domain-containing ABC transporter [Enterococcus mundtii]|uniref:peptidase domain-containing ABC transporter n=1 Tax=Enterococcus mundtii TaxID=53346 RepID=UPI0008EDE281|nr:ATP-binding cassette domain-containing protein [Enterococcus mundtii]SFM23586.1 ABC-type bacteriocin/lantibiotic exporter, contains an N-terminal double-glycine peptidase domain [Enterococcus mundtii]
MNFKITPQSGEADCGAACVSMLLTNYFNKVVSLCEIRPIIKNTHTGTSFGDLKEGLTKIGIKATIFKAEKDKAAFNEMKAPLLTQIKKTDNSYHYLLLIKITNKHVYYADPELSKIQKKTIDVFIKSWIPYIIQIDLKNSALDLDIIENLQKLNYRGLLRNVKGKVTLIIILSLLSYMLGLFIASMYTTYFDIIVPNSLIGLIFSIMIVYLIAALFKFILNFLTTIVTNSLNKTIDAILSTEFFQTLFRKSTASLEYFGMGDIIATLSNIIMIRQRFFTLIIAVPLNVILVLSSFYILTRINLYLAFLLLSLIIIFLLIIIYSNEKYLSFSKKLIQSNKEFNDNIIDTFSNINTIKQYQQETYFVDRGKNKLVENISIRNSLLNFDAKLEGIKAMVLDMFNVILFSLGSYLIIKGTFVTGTLLMYNSIIGFTINPILMLINSQSLITQGKVAEELLFNLLSSELNHFGSSSFPNLETKNAIIVKNLGFAFDGRKPLLKNINLKIEDKTSIAFTGSNGSGKTTLGKLLARLYLPDKGEILLNRTNINCISESELVKNLIYIDSEEKIMSATILENICLGRIIDSEKLKQISESTGLHDLIQNLPMGYDTPIGIDGINLSLGQKQLIKIARATVEEKRIYIFDEITNGLDKANKSKLINYLIGLPGIKIFITHDTELVQSCHKEINVDKLTSK